MLLNEKTYRVIKWVVAVVLPALTTLVGAVGTALGWSDTDLCLTIMVAVTTFLGTVMGVSTKQYNKDDYEEEDIDD